MRYYVNGEQTGNKITIKKSSGGDVITLKAEVLESEESENVIYIYVKQISTYVNGVGIDSITPGEDGSIDITTTDGNKESIAIPTQNSLTMYKRSSDIYGELKPIISGLK